MRIYIIFAVWFALIVFLLIAIMWKFYAYKEIKNQTPSTPFAPQEETERMMETAKNLKQ